MRSVSVLFVCATSLAAVAGLSGQVPQTGPAKPEIPAARGTLSVTDEAAATILGSVKAPADFAVSVFAAPPVANYPVSLTATYDDAVFVCVDRNGSLQADAGMGYILRLVDRDADGRAEEYTVFATLDSPRGAVFDGDALYVSHPPYVTALRDTNGDGIADDRRTLVRGLGFGLDFRGADHTTNGIEMGIDGWLYVAVGDYGAVKATGADGREIQMRGGGNVRVRPDGSNLEIYSRGTRNDYDLAIDPYMNLFARGNTNDGGGFDIRMYHFVEGATFGYPSLFRNFSTEVVPPIADYGTGSGTGMLYIDDAGLPTPYGSTLYSVDWGRNGIFRHTLTPKGATFGVDQEPFVTLPRPTDMALDGSSRMYLASWVGGQFNYAGPQVGYVVQLRHRSAKPAARADLSTATDAALVDLIGSANQVHRRFAQQALLRRGSSPARIALLERQMQGTGPLAGRAAALFTLKQLAGEAATPVLVKAVSQPALRALALRALTDRRDQLSGVPQALFAQALADPDPRVQLAAVTGLKRLGAVDAARGILPLTVSGDTLVANIAVNALVSLRATEAALQSLAPGNDAVAPGALRVLQQLHEPRSVGGLIDALAAATSADRQLAILQALARLHYREGVWRGTLPEWWGTRPDTTGPYYDPVTWDETPRITAVLKAAVRQTAGRGSATPPADRVFAELQRNRVVPPGAADLLSTLATSQPAALTEAADLLVGRQRLDVDADTAARLDRVARLAPALRVAIVRMVSQAGPPTAAGGEMLRAAAVDSAVPAAVRASALTTLATGTGPEALGRSIDAFSAAYVGPGIDPALETTWRTFVNAPGHAANLAAFREASMSSDFRKQLLGYAVLVQVSTVPPAPAGRGGGRGAGGGGGGGGGGRGRGQQAAAIEAARAEARAIVDAAWASAPAPALVRAVGLVASVQYRDQVEGVRNSPNAEVREAATFAAARLAALPPAAPATAPAAAGPPTPLVTTVPYAELAGRLSSVTGTAAAGRTVFERQGCGGCHTVAVGEPEKGPFLGGIATRYSRAELIESILRPSARVAQGFATNVIETTDNRQVSGFVVREGQADVVMRDLAGVETTIAKPSIKSRSVAEGSMMPPGLVDSLTLSELASLLVFLESTSGK